MNSLKKILSSNFSLIPIKMKVSVVLLRQLVSYKRVGREPSTLKACLKCGYVKGREYFNRATSMSLE